MSVAAERAQDEQRQDQQEEDAQTSDQASLSCTQQQHHQQDTVLLFFTNHTIRIYLFFQSIVFFNSGNEAPNKHTQMIYRLLT